MTTLHEVVKKHLEKATIETAASILLNRFLYSKVDMASGS